MKQVFKKLFSCFRFFFNCIADGLKNEIKQKNGKKKIFLQIISLFILVLTGMLALSNTKLSLENHVTNYIFNNINSGDYGVIYKHSTYEKSYILSSNEPESSIKLRSVDHNVWCIDAYFASDSYGVPAFYKDSNSINHEPTLLLAPKETYVNNSFKEGYNFGLLVGGTDGSANSEDIFVNENYAKTLLDISNPTIENYKSLINKVVSIPYKTKYRSDDINYSYKIKGVLDSNNEFNKQISKIVGDFFVCSQYLQLPMASMTLFKLPQSFQEIKNIVDVINNVYKYDSVLKYINATDNTYPYEYRIGFVSDYFSTLSIKTIDTEQNTNFKNINNIYDYYFFKNNIIPEICFFLINIVFTVLFCFSITNYKTQKNMPYSFFKLLLLAICFCGSVCLCPYILRMFTKASLTSSYWLCFIIPAVEIIICFIFSFLKGKKIS